MTIYGKEYKFCLTTWASGQIASLCPNGTLENLAEYLDENTPQNDLFYRIAKIATILNKAAIMKEHYESGLPMAKWEHIEPLPEEMILSLSLTEFIDVQKSVMDEIVNGTKTTVEVKDDASKNATGEADT